MTHLVRRGPLSGLAGLGRTGLSGSSLPVPLGPGLAILPAQPLERLDRTGHPLARPSAMGSCRRRLSCALAPAYLESRLASRCEREQPTSERLQAATPWQPGADSSEPALLRAEVPRLPPARCLPYLPRLVLRIVSRASVPPRLHQNPNTRCQCTGRAND
jgi:hypothetical protein